MPKDHLKYYRAIDDRDLKNERERIASLQDAGMYPRSFDFPLTLQFELTSRCNVFCKHCYNKSGGPGQNDAMTPERWIEFAKYLVAHGGIFECILSGGEPLLLGDKLFDIMDILHDDGVGFLLITNGYLLDEKVVSRLRKYRYHWIQVSIDGSEPAFHDEFRQREGSWQRAVDGAFLVTAAGLPLTIAHSVTPGNIDKIDEMCDLAYALGASSIILGDINLSGRADSNREILLDRDQKSMLLELYESNAQRYAGRMLVRRAASTKTSLERYSCTPTNGIIVRPNGDIRLDCMAPFTIGNILRDDFETVWREKGVGAWQSNEVKRYIDSFDDNDVSSMITNYIDRDIQL